MLRPIDPIVVDSQTRPTERAIPMSAGERRSNDEEPPASGLGEAAVVELGSGTQALTQFAQTYNARAGAVAQAIVATTPQAAAPPQEPVATDAAGVATQATTATTSPATVTSPATIAASASTVGNAAAASSDATTSSAGVTAVTASQYKIVRGAGGVEYARSGHTLVSPAAIHQDPAQAIRELDQIRQAALIPPTTPSDLQLAAQATIDVQRAQLELARLRYAHSATSDSNEQKAAVDPATTDIRA